jgi:hypothetical protein
MNTNVQFGCHVTVDSIDMIKTEDNVQNVL